MDVKKNIQNMLVACNAVNEGEKILIVADNQPRPAHLGQTLLDSMLEMGLDTTLAVIPPRQVDGAEPTAAVAAAMKYSSGKLIHYKYLPILHYIIDITFKKRICSQ